MMVNGTSGKCEFVTTTRSASWAGAALTEKVSSSVAAKAEVSSLLQLKL
jgi:hypothetical protein